MRTFGLVGIAFGLVACAGGDSRPDPAAPVEVRTETAVVADHRPPPDASAAVASAVFACARYQTYCGGIDRYVAVCRARDATATFLLPQNMIEDKRPVVATYKPIPARTETVHVRSCAGEFTVDVNVDAEVVESQHARDLDEAQAMLARMRSVP